MTTLSFSVPVSTELAALLHCSMLAMAMGYHLLPLRHGTGISHGACWVRNHQLTAWGSESVRVTEKPATPFQYAANGMSHCSDKTSFCWQGFVVPARSHHPSDTTFQLVVFSPRHSLAKMLFWKQLQVAAPTPRKRLRLNQVC